MSTFVNKIAVICGGTSGIGAQVASMFVERGGKIVIGGRRAETGEALAKRLGRNAAFIRTDVRLEEDVERIVSFAFKRHGRIDCLLNNAGGPASAASILDIEGSDFDEGLAVHVRGVLFGTKHAAKVMRDQNFGSIINTASINGSRAGMTALTYSVAKAAVIHLSRCAAIELGEYGIRVNSISPGPVVTGIFGKGSPKSDHTEADRRADRVRKVFAELLPESSALPWPGEPEDIAEAVMFLASDASRMVTGVDLVVDGGLLAGRPARVLRQERELFKEALRS